MEYKKLVGIMIPTRKRVNLLQECLDSFNQKTNEKSLVELLIKIDTDDEETIKFVENYILTSEIDIKVVISDRKNGYGSLHEHYNSLAKASEAEFLFGMNDDIEILTDSWEQQFKKYKNHYHPTEKPALNLENV
jgi:GT2 family glycosyltransferase